MRIGTHRWRLRLCMSCAGMIAGDGRRPATQLRSLCAPEFRCGMESFPQFVTTRFRHIPQAMGIVGASRTALLLKCAARLSRRCQNTSTYYTYSRTRPHHVADSRMACHDLFPADKHNVWTRRPFDEKHRT